MLLLHSSGYHAILAIGLVHRHHSWVGLLLSTLRTCMVPSGTIKASSQGGGFQIRSSSHNAGPGST